MTTKVQKRLCEHKLAFTSSFQRLPANTHLEARLLQLLQGLDPRLLLLLPLERRLRRGLLLAGLLLRLLLLSIKTHKKSYS